MLRKTSLQTALLAGLVVLIAVMAPLAVEVAPVRAQGGEFDLPDGVTWDDVNSIARRLYCDVCEGIPLDECESVACRRWREEIARLLGEGRTRDEIMDYFVERYGADVASLPRSTADRILAFAVPAGIVLIIGLIGALQVRQFRLRGQRTGELVRRSGSPLQARPVPDDVDPAYLERLERELEGLEL
jgi:cytochrome c-type biogenesis protein CcmH